MFYHKKNKTHFCKKKIPKRKFFWNRRFGWAMKNLLPVIKSEKFVRIKVRHNIANK